MRNQNQMQTMSLLVTDDLTVTILPNPNHEFLMTTKEVAKGYDINESTLRVHLHRYKSDIIENKHFVKGVTICNTLNNITGIQPHQIFWTKAGIVRLAMFLTGDRAKLFRDWIEKLVLQYLENKMPALPETPKRKHNRLTQERLIDIFQDLILIEDLQLRKRLTHKIFGGQE